MLPSSHKYVRHTSFVVSCLEKKKMSISWKYGDLSPARYPFREEKEEKKKKPSKRSRASQKHDVVREAAESPAKIMKDAKEIRRQKDAEWRKKKREEKRNETKRS